MGRIRMLAPLVPRGTGRTVAIAPKQADPFYQSKEHLAWREQVIARAGRRCEATENGKRCHKAEPAHRMFADHIKERRDGGDPIDPANGQCLCGRHHSLKTARSRATRQGTC